MASNMVTAQSLQQAVEALRSSYGERIDGGQETGMVNMRKAVEAAMGVSESEADLLVKTLVQNRQIMFRGADKGADQTREPVAPLPREDMGMGTYANSTHGLVTPIAGIMFNQDTPSESPSLLQVNEEGYWTINDDGAERYLQAGGPEGETYDQPVDTNSYAADLHAAGESGDATARERQ